VKVGVVTDDGKTISPHFGMAQYFLVYDIEDGSIKGKELRPKAGHHHGGMEHPAGSTGHHQGEAEASLHENMLSSVADCEALITRGMGWGMREAIGQSGKKSFITDVENADEAVRAYIDGGLDDHAERLHGRPSCP
jgi:predicted Fe-Mo cluster-binding NifX family protein